MSIVIVVEKPSTQYEAFESRVKSNLHVLNLEPEVMQYWIEHPQLIPGAFRQGFRTRLVLKERDAREVIEKFIREVPAVSNNHPPEQIVKFRKLLIWFLRQSKGMTEEIKLHSPFDPDDQINGIKEFARNASYFVHSLLSSLGPVVTFGLVLRGIGCPLLLSTGSNGEVASFYLTSQAHDGTKARRLSWADAMRAVEEKE